MLARLMRIAAASAVIAGLGFLALRLFLLANVDTPPVALEKLTTLRVGMDKASVRQVLGEPIERRPKKDWIVTVPGEVWIYARPLSVPIVYVHFDADGRFEEFVYDR